MKNNITKLFLIITATILFAACKKTDYKLGDLTAPANVQITTEVIGQDASNPDGDGSGAVKVTVKADNAISYKVDFDASNATDLVYLEKGTITFYYTTQGVHTYTITAVAYGKGATSTSATTEVTVKSDFQADPQIVEDLTDNSSKTWRVDEDVAGHFGVGPWDPAVITPIWWSAAPHEKAACCPCFYSAHFTFNKVGNNSFSIDVTSPDGAFTKTGSLTSLPGIPSSGPEGCYNYTGGSGPFSFARSTAGSTPATSSTQTSIMLSGVNTYIGYGALQKEYEIMEITPSYMYLRVQGTETGNAWYLKLEPL